MKKYILTLLYSVSTILVMGSIPQLTKLELKDFKSIDPNIADVTYQMFGDEWPITNSRGTPTALIILSFENINLDTNKDDISCILFGSTLRKQEFRKEDKLKRYWIWIDAADDIRMEIKLRGITSNRISLPSLSPKKIYEITLEGIKQHTIHISTVPQNGISLTLNDTPISANTDVPNIPAGEHILKIWQDGRLVKEDHISVSDSTVYFNYDLRKKKNIKITSDPIGATIYLDNKEIGRAPMTIELAYDSYEIEAKINGESDTRTFTVNDFLDEIQLNPVPKRNFIISAYYDEKEFESEMFIDGKRQGGIEEKHNISLSIGQKYKIELKSPDGARTISATKKLTNTTPTFIELKDGSSIWRRYEPANWGISAGYISKQWNTQSGDSNLKENIWGDPNKWIYGVRAGFHVSPGFWWGLGLHTGLYYEFYTSSNDHIRKQGGMYNFQEHALYIPLHTYYRFPLSKDYCIFLRGGIGMDIGLAGIYSGNGETSSLYYEANTGRAPRRIGFAGEAAIDIRLGPVLVSATYSKGFTDHGFYSVTDNNAKTYQDKIALALSYVFKSKSSSYGSSIDISGPWENYEPKALGLDFGYVTKQYESHIDDKKHTENIWGEENKWVHGLRVGMHCQPCFWWGLGMYTGAFYEYYYSATKGSSGSEYEEHNVYIPLHLCYNFPFAEDISLFLRGGVGMDIGCSAGFGEQSSSFYNETGRHPRRINFAGEAAIDLRIKRIKISASYSRGLTDHAFYTDMGDITTIQNKISISIAFVFSHSPE